LAHSLKISEVTSRELRRILKRRGCVEERQRGSHLFVRCGRCTTVIPVHPGEDIGTGLLSKIKRDLAPCLGADWL
jgi:predicted RNA binding protein YcfA (HicA-like mRNA interferase family)